MFTLPPLDSYQMKIKFLALPLIIVSAATSHAATTVLTSSKDTYIRNSSATSNFGTGTTMVSNFSGTDIRYALFSFDISSISETVSGVKLQLADNAGNAATKSYQIYGLVDAQDGWVENALTWNGAAVPAGFISGGTLDLTDTYGGVKLGDFNTAQNANFTAFDVTSGAHVNFLNADTNNTITFIIVDPVNDVPGSGWATKENGAGVLKPTLTITTVPEPSAALLGGLGLLALLRRRR